MENHLVFVKTGQTSTIRTLFESLKDILTEVNMEFTDSGIRIMTFDVHKKALVFVKLEAARFENFYCPEPFVAAVTMSRMFKIIKTSRARDTLYLSVEKDDPHRLHIQMQNTEKNVRSDFFLPLPDLGYKHSPLKPTEYDAEITINSTDFQNICRNMHNLEAETVEIQSIDQQLILKCKGAHTEQSTVLGQRDDHSVNFDKTSPGIIQGEFELGYLLRFCKATNLCSLVKMYLKNDMPLVLEYAVGQLGSIKFVLMQKM